MLARTRMLLTRYTSPFDVLCLSRILIAAIFPVVLSMSICLATVTADEICDFIDLLRRL